jgi:hypothetical protein
MRAGGSVALNGETLGRLGDLRAIGRFDVTTRLRPRNELQIVWHGAAPPDQPLDAPPGEAFLEIRSD